MYSEISGRRLDQWSGELHPVDVDSLIDAPNPLGHPDASFTAEHVSAITTMLRLSTLGVRPRVLDMGAGHGLSSEILAFCGCDVHSVDIDPKLGELAMKRAGRRGLTIRRSNLNYDDLLSVEDDTYQAAFFFQSLHHSLRLWDLVEMLNGKLTGDGVIAFTDEPINDRWRNWGIRLDHESLYVARRFGWYESGWSHWFIRQCFARNGCALTFFSGGHGNGEIAVASANAMRVHAAEAAATRMGLSKRYPID